MSHAPISTELRCELSRCFSITQSDINLLRYSLKLLPSKYGGNQEAILSFEDEVKNGHSDGHGEGEIFLSFLSLLFNCKVSKTGYRANGLDISGKHSENTSDYFDGEIVLSDPEASVKSLFTLGDQLTKQFVRACNAYSLAIVSTELDRSLSFLLLVTAIECLSTQEDFCKNKELDKSKKSTERYCRFVKTYCKNVHDLYPNKDKDAFVRDLKTVYYSHRSGFVHGGKEVSIASKIADDHNLNNIGHFVDGKEIFSPSLKWFFKVTRGSLLGFLHDFPREEALLNQEVLADIARSRVVLNMRWGGS